MAANLKRALAGAHAVRVAPTWDDFATAIAERRFDAVVIDPCADARALARRRGLADLAPVLARAPLVPIIGYVSVSANAMRAMLDLIQHGAVDIVVRGVDDQPARLRFVVERAAAGELAMLLIERLKGRLAVLPPMLVGAVQLLFRTPDRFQSIDDLADAAGMSRRSLDRWLRRATTAPARQLIAGARTVAAYRLLQSRDRRVRDVARLLGYRSIRALEREVSLAAGCTPRALRTVGTNAFVERTFAALVRRDDETLPQPPSARRPKRTSAARWPDVAQPGGLPVGIAPTY